MQVEVTYFGKLRQLTRVRQQTYSLDEGSRLSDLVARITQDYGPGFQEEMEQIRDLGIFVRGQHHEVLDGMATALKDGDSVVFLPPIAGG